MDENVDEAKNHLQQVPTSLLRKKIETSLKLSTSTAGKRAIILTVVLKRENKCQKTSNGLCNLYAGDCS